MKNSVQLIGALGKNPEYRADKNGSGMALITLVTKDYVSDTNGGQRCTKNWHSLIAFGTDADVIIKHLKKGSFILVEGRLFTNSFEDINGQRRNLTEIHVNELQVLSKKEKLIQRAA